MKKLTKKQTGILSAHNRSYKTALYQVYGKWSWAKQKAYDYCKELCEKQNGWDFRIIGHNSNMFSVGWFYTNPETGDIIFHYETNRTTLEFTVSERIA